MAGSAIILLLGSCFLVRRWHTPPDCVVVTVKNDDPAIRFICLLVESPSGPAAMLYAWHYSYDMGVYRFHPNQYPGTPNGNYGTIAGVGSPAKLQVAWQEADQYGVLTWDGTDDWRVWWFDRDEVPVQESSWLFGGGYVTIDLRGEGKRASPELLDRVGFGPELRERWRAVRVNLLKLGTRKRDLGQYSDCVKAMQEFLAKEKDGSDRAIGLFLQATCQARLGETATAQELYEQASHWVEANRERLLKEGGKSKGTLIQLDGFQAAAQDALREAKRKRKTR